MSGNRLQNLSPLILRLALGAALAMHGYRQFGVSPTQAGGESAIGESAVPAPIRTAETGLDPLQAVDSTPPSLNVTPTGVSVDTNWRQIVGGTELATAFALLLGFLTRWVTLGVLSAAGYAGLGSQLGGASGMWGRLGEILPQASDPLLILIAAVSLTLLLSGCGSLGLDGRVFKRGKPSMDLTTP